MKSNFKKLTRIKDILDIDGQITISTYENFEKSLTTLQLGTKEMHEVIVRFLSKKKNDIIANLKQEKLVKVRSSIGIYVLFIPSETDGEFLIASPYVEGHISLENYQSMLVKQGINVSEAISEVLYVLPVITKKKFNYLLEFLQDSEDVDYDKVVVYDDSFVKARKKIVLDRKYLTADILKGQAIIHDEVKRAVKHGDITKLNMLFDLSVNNYVPAYDFEIGENLRKEKRAYINDVLHSVLSHSEANILDVDSLWVKIKNQLDNYDFSSDVIREYCLLVDRERYRTKQPVVRNCITYINDHIREKINLNDISAYLGVNKSYLSSIFNREMDFSIVDYIHEKRISNSKYLLANTDMSISEIADYIGYFDTSYFIRIFKSLTKTTPLKYRESFSDDK